MWPPCGFGLAKAFPYERSDDYSAALADLAQTARVQTAQQSERAAAKADLEETTRVTTKDHRHE